MYGCAEYVARWLGMDGLNWLTSRGIGYVVWFKLYGLTIYLLCWYGRIYDFDTIEQRVFMAVLNAWPGVGVGWP